MWRRAGGRSGLPSASQGRAWPASSLLHMQWARCRCPRKGEACIWHAHSVVRLWCALPRRGAVCGTWVVFSCGQFLVRPVACAFVCSVCTVYSPRSVSIVSVTDRASAQPFSQGRRGLSLWPGRGARAACALRWPPRVRGGELKLWWTGVRRRRSCLHRLTIYRIRAKKTDWGRRARP